MSAWFGRITVSCSCFPISLRHIIYFIGTKRGNIDRKFCGKYSTLEEKWSHLEMKCNLLTNSMETETLCSEIFCHMTRTTLESRTLVIKL